MRWAPAILIGRAVRFAARLRKPGGGSAFPGVVVGRIAPGFLPAMLNSFDDLVIVSGSSGKSTTTKMLVHVLEAHGKRVFTNPSTANITQGLTSALIERASLGGRIDADLAVLEMDEGHGANVAASLSPTTVVLTNVMTDQIDRFENSEKVLGMLARIAVRSTQSLVSNADDAMLESIAATVAPNVAVERFGVTAEVLAANPRGLGYAATSPARASEGTLVTRVEGAEATIVVNEAAVDVRLPSRGTHYATDAAAALSAAAAILGPGFDPAVAARAISAMPPVFGRGETLTVRGQVIEFVLVQNPASFQLNVDELPVPLDRVLVAIGSDVRDPSYFWPVDASRIGRVSIVSGSKAHEIALQLQYQGVEIDEIDVELGRALDRFLELPAPEHGSKTIIFSADSMRRTRAHWGLSA